MSVPVKIDHVEAGLDRLITFFKDKPNVVGLLRSYLEQFNVIEDVLFQMLEERGIYEAVGVQLNNIGALFNVSRDNQSDIEYRDRILRRIAVLDSDGTTEVFLQGLRNITGQEFVTFFEHPSAEVHAYVGGGANHNTWNQVQDIKPAGIKARVYVSDQFNAFTPTELVQSLYDLETNVPDDVEVTPDSGTTVYDLQVNVNTSVSNPNSVLAELGEADVAICAELLYRDIPAEFGNLVDENGDQLVDEFGNPIYWSEYSF